MKKLLIFSLLLTLFSACGETKEKEETNITTKDLTLVTGEYELDGKLTLPNSTGSYPVVIFVHGSGPNDMDETIGSTKLFKSLATQLAEQGIASYRYDKRTLTYGVELIEDLDSTVQEQIIDDVLSAIDLVGKQDGVDKDNIYIAGHSFGGYFIPKMNQQTDVPKGYIMLAANARPIYEMIPEQLEYLTNEDGVVTDEEQMLIDEYNRQIDLIKNLDKAADTDAMIGYYKAYWVDLVGYEAVELAKEIDKPVLVLQGGRDYQVTEVDYNLWKSIEKDNWSYIMYPELTHVFNQGSEPPSPSDYVASSKIDESLAKDIANWITK